MVLSEFRGKVLGSPIVSAASSFFTVSVPGGTCSGLSGTFTAMGQSFDVDMTNAFCGGAADMVYAAIGFAVLVVGGWVAFRIAIL